MNFPRVEGRHVFWVEVPAWRASRAALPLSSSCSLGCCGVPAWQAGLPQAGGVLRTSLASLLASVLGPFCLPGDRSPKLIHLPAASQQPTPFLQHALELPSSLYTEEVGHNAHITSCRAPFGRSHLLRVRGVPRMLLKGHVLWGSAILRP